MSGFKRVLGAAAITGAVLFGMSGCFLSDDRQHEDVSYGVGEAVKTLVVRSDTGDVKVTGGGTAVQVTEHRSYRDEQPDATHATAADGTLTLGYSCPDHDCAVGYEVKVPAGTVVRVVAGTGSVQLAGLKAEVDARTETGSIHAGELAGAKASLSSQTGDVSATFTGDVSEVHGSTETGSIRLKLPTAAAYQVNAKAQTGNVNVGVRQDPAATRTVTATTQTGDVTVTGA
ncbi:hypothetical protein CFP65_2987 [Kitasatospora sp. MMS16-BH015]|uniref:DUF4097 family beta strand repeat-containing protein n=1 Tax=Kitasatospora sp. MMS16-BH015 TaxID=2018025 RepID=UPI000CA102A4|nr:DUF4097 family beta strand repeat-containing protein [Kitasatospora sp. MMS16-BH015]AUG77797.1 hypothetical protein CFP65_2987 [Kitasatospora sp. MMS16-BH015]